MRGRRSRRRTFTVSTNGRVLRDGQDFVVKGVNVNGPGWVWPRNTAQDAASIVDVWKFNTVRVNVRIGPEFVAGDNGADGDPVALQTLVDAFAIRGCVVILALHNRTGGYFTPTTATTLAQATAWWTARAQQFKDNPLVWFSLHNEPGSGGPVRPEWLIETETMLQAIRDAGANNFVLCEEHDFSTVGASRPEPYVRTDDSAALLHGLYLKSKFSNILFEIHVYHQWNNGGAAKMNHYFQRLQDLGLGVLVGEWGMSAFEPFESVTATTLDRHTEKRISFPTTTGRFLRIETIGGALATRWIIRELNAYAEAVGPAPDFTAPTQPSRIEVSQVTLNSAILTWDAATDDRGVAGYDLFANGVCIAQTSGLTYTATGLTPATPYVFAVRTRDTSGNLSRFKKEVATATEPGTFSRVYEAEEASTSGRVRTLRPGFRGAGYVTLSRPDETIEWTVTPEYPGSTFALIRYASDAKGGAASFTVNGGEPLRFNLPPTAGHGAWRFFRITLPLTEGTNVIRLAAARTDIDQLVLTPTDVRPTGVLQESAGQVAMEAENYHEKIDAANNQTWTEVSQPSGYSDRGAMQALPNNGINTDAALTGPVLEYDIQFQTVGTYYVYVRGSGASGNDDSVQVTLDGVRTTGNSGINTFSPAFNWRNSGAQVTISAPGLRTLQVYMREDGVVVDKVVLSTNPTLFAAGSTEVGPSESPRAP